jgi:hypothetical protein
MGEIYESTRDLKARFEEFGWEDMAAWAESEDISVADLRQEAVLAARAALNATDAVEVRFMANFISGFMQGYCLAQRRARSNGEE